MRMMPRGSCSGAESTITRPAIFSGFAMVSNLAIIARKRRERQGSDRGKGLV